MSSRLSEENIIEMQIIKEIRGLKNIVNGIPINNKDYPYMYNCAMCNKEIKGKNNTIEQNKLICMMCQ